MLDSHRRVILQIEARMDQLAENTTRKAAPLIEEPVARGLGECARAQMRAEVLDWHRFNNRSQVGSFIGCCPSEYSSGGSRKLGSIDRMGNKRLRCMLVEAVWRLHQWNQGWRGFQKFHHVLGAGVKTGAAAKKKAIVACARLLAIDLWKIETGQIKPQDVGLLLADAGVSLPKAKPSPWHGVKAAKHNLCNEETFERRTPGRRMPPERQPISDRSPDRVAGVRAQPSRRIDIMRSGLCRRRG